MGIDEGARKLRRAAERKQGAREKPQDEHERHRADAESAAAHHELTQPQHSKGRPVTRAEILARIRAPRKPYLRTSEMAEQSGAEAAGENTDQPATQIVPASTAAN